MLWSTSDYFSYYKRKHNWIFSFDFLLSQKQNMTKKDFGVWLENFKQISAT